MSNTITRTITTAAVAAGIAGAAFAGAGTANASSESFTTVLGLNGWHESSPGYLLDVGYEVCRELGQGYSYATATTYVYYSTSAVTSWSDSRWFVSTAQNHLCSL